MLSGQAAAARQSAAEQVLAQHVTYFKVVNPETGQYEDRPIPTLPSSAYPMPVQAEISGPSASVPAVPDAVPVPAKKPARKRSEMTKAEQLLDSFATSAVNGAGRELGRTISRGLLGVLGLTGRKKRR